MYHGENCIGKMKKKGELSQDNQQIIIKEK